ncbi:uncharacterized protein LOC144105536 isoform X2 [Amblyomma americanum]
MLSVVFFALAGCSLVAGSVQTPELTSCSSEKSINLSNVSISDAQIGKIMTANFTLTTSQKLESDNKLEVTVYTASGSKIHCLGHIGSCTYHVCGGNSTAEQLLGQPWNNKCPVPEKTMPLSYSVRVPWFIQMAIGSAPTTLHIRLKMTKGDTVIGCELLQVNIAAADSEE